MHIPLPFWLSPGFALSFLEHETSRIEPHVALRCCSAFLSAMAPKTIFIRPVAKYPGSAKSNKGTGKTYKGTGMSKGTGKSDKGTGKSDKGCGKSCEDQVRLPMWISVLDTEGQHEQITLDVEAYYTIGLIKRMIASLWGEGGLGWLLSIPGKGILADNCTIWAYGIRTGDAVCCSMS
jgi:hypothetical protein